jgi:ABC-type branched-subunit amino acid transport system ATPase component
VFVTGIANAVAAFLRYRVGTIAMQDTEIEVAMHRQMPHTGNKRLFKRAIIRPFREHSVNGRVMDAGPAIAIPGHWQALPLHARIEHPQDEVEDAGSGAI